MSRASQPNEAYRAIVSFTSAPTRFLAATVVPGSALRSRRAVIREPLQARGPKRRRRRGNACPARVGALWRSPRTGCRRRAALLDAPYDNRAPTATSSRLTLSARCNITAHAAPASGKWRNRKDNQALRHAVHHRRQRHQRAAGLERRQPLPHQAPGQGWAAGCNYEPARGVIPM
jgi:hypothetical protein